jgi:hypothetical protein
MARRSNATRLDKPLTETVCKHCKVHCKNYREDLNDYK